VDNKRKRQDRQAKQMIERRAKHAKESGAALGALVRIGEDRSDVFNPRSAIGVIVDLKSGTGGVKVCTEDGVLSQGANKKDFWMSEGHV
jgi:biotin synthase-like enzyme